MITERSNPLRSAVRRLDEILLFGIFAAYGAAVVIQVIRDYILAAQ